MNSFPCYVVSEIFSNFPTQPHALSRSASSGNNYNRVDAMETLEAFQALKNDPDAFEKYKTQRKQRVEQIRENARALTEWKDDRTVANSAKNRNATWRRKTAYVHSFVFRAIILG